MMQPQSPEAAFKQALRLVAREVALRDRARVLELVPGQREEADRLFTLAFLLRRERLRVLVEAGVLEPTP